MAMRSVERNGDVAGADLIIACHGASAADRDAMAVFQRRHGTRAWLVEADVSDLPDGDFGRGISRATLMRLVLPRVIGADYRRVLYLDADTLVLESLRPLLAADLAGKPFGAVPDVGMMEWFDPAAAANKAEIGLGPGAPYFNAGVLLFDWQATFADGFLDAALARYRTGFLPLFADQGLLNAVAAGRWQSLPFRWNTMHHVSERVAVDTAILHFSGRRKPWDHRCAVGDRRFNRHYVEALADTPFAAFARPLDWTWPFKQRHYFSHRLRARFSPSTRWRHERERTRRLAALVGARA